MVTGARFFSTWMPPPVVLPSTLMVDSFSCRAMSPRTSLRSS